jgi:hypothetical protein
MKAMASPDLPPLYVTDEEICARLGISLKRWGGSLQVLLREGLPPRDPVAGDKRYWPAVKLFFDRRHGISTMPGGMRPDGEENLDAFKHSGKHSGP